jgi:Holliday junction resolvasome RuvABC endonuclease subunit
MIKKNYRILSIDPALSSCGWSILDLVIEQYKKNTEPQIIVNRFGCIKSYQEAIKAANREKAEFYSKSLLSLSLLKKNISKLLDEFKPNFVTIEDAFFNPKRPSAYASLINCISTISLLCKEHYLLPVYRIPTRSAKQCIFGEGGANKNDIREAVLASKNITFKQKKNIDNLDEHEADSIAVGYFFILNILPGLLSNNYFETIKNLKEAENEH